MNMMTGHAFLKKELGYTVKAAWHADAFGHSAATPELFAQMGLEAIFFGRIDDEEKRFRKQNKSMEFIWQPTFESPNGSSLAKREIFAHTMHELYQGACGLDISE